MNSIKIVQQVAHALESLGISYMLVGSFSSNVYAVPRSTQDADFVIEYQPGQISELRSRLQSELVVDPQTQFETVTGTYKNVVHVVGSDFVVELFRLSQDPHDQARFQRRRVTRSLGFPIWIPSAEDVIITKLRWAVAAGRGKDRDDIKEIISVQKGNLDWSYIYSWADKHETRQCLDEIRKAIPPDLLND